jgi:hypothetical protein
MSERGRFDPELLNEHAPFEIDDGNRPHLVKHSPYTPEDLTDAWRDPNRLFFAATAEGPADWLLLARLPGGDLVQIPLAPPHSGDWRTCRPIGIYPANPIQARRYEEEKQ